MKSQQRGGVGRRLNDRTNHRLVVSPEGDRNLVRLEDARRDARIESRHGSPFREETERALDLHLCNLCIGGRCDTGNQVARKKPQRDLVRGVKHDRVARDQSLGYCGRHGGRDRVSDLQRLHRDRFQSAGRDFTLVRMIATHPASRPHRFGPCRKMDESAVHRNMNEDEHLDDLARGALDAAVGLGRELGLELSAPRILSNEQNLLVHLWPSPVVARVATRIAWSRPDPAAWLSREVAVATYAARNGGPVVPPTDLVDPGPHRVQGYDMSLWTYVDAGGELAAEAEVGEALGRLHRSLEGFPSLSLPEDLPVHAQIRNGLAALERESVIDRQTLDELRAMHQRYSGELAGFQGTRGVIHGDAHPWNLLRTDAGWRWTDMEETGSGPQEFDLAVLVSKVDDPRAALDAYASTMGRAAVELEILAPFQRIRELESVVWGLGMSVTDPSYREDAKARLDRLLQ